MNKYHPYEDTQLCQTNLMVVPYIIKRFASKILIYLLDILSDQDLPQSLNALETTKLVQTVCFLTTLFYSHFKGYLQKVVLFFYMGSIESVR